VSVFGITLQKCCSDRTVLIFVFIFSISVSFLVHWHSQRALFNDEAHELILTEGVPLDRFYFICPSDAYPSGSVAPVEMGQLYINRYLFWIFQDYFVKRDDFLVPLHAFNTLILALSCLCFYCAIRKYTSQGLAALGAVMLATSYTALLFNQFVTRNTTTIIWGCLLILFLPGLIDGSQKTFSQKLRAALICAILVLAGMSTFTSYLLAAVAIWTSLGIVWLRFDRKWSNLGWIMFSGSVFSFGYLFLCYTSTYSLSAILFRGTYAMNGMAVYVENAILTLLSPVYYATDGSFFKEDVHIIFGRPLLAFVFAPFYFIGLVYMICSRRPLVFLAVIVWVIGALLCALSGPNPKYIYTFFPLILLISLFGASILRVLIAKHLGNTAANVILGLLLLFAVVDDLKDVFKQPHDMGREIVNTLPRHGAELAIKSVESGRDTYIYFGLGYDILNWYLWPREIGIKVKRCSVTEELPALFLQFPPQPDSVLFVDFPPESLPQTLKGWTPPKEVSVDQVKREELEVQ